VAEAFFAADFFEAAFFVVFVAILSPITFAAVRQVFCANRIARFCFSGERVFAG
jgi:hypothetical protein